MKTCPYCAEEIQEEAILCRYCKKELLVPPPPVPAYVPKSKANKKKKSKTAAIIGGVILFILACLAFSVFWDFFVSPTISAVSPTRTPYPTMTIPTHTPYPTLAYGGYSSHDNFPSGCIGWSQVTQAMIGKTICVTGTVYRNVHVAGTTTQILFSKDPNRFFLASGTFYYPDVKIGDCVRAEGRVLENTYHVPYIDIDNGLDFCN